jgi:ASCH domain
METMKCLSGRQPWWWAILHAGKRIENRVWNTSYRGPILLHAAKGCTVDEYEDACIWMENAGVIAHISKVPPLKDMQRGGIVGRARIVNVCLPRNPSDEMGFDDGYPGLVDGRWHMRDQYGFILADVEALPFVPYKGALGLFDVPDDLVS